MFNCCNNSTRCSSCNRFYPNCSWYTCPGYNRFYMPYTFRPIQNTTQTLSASYLTAPASTVASGANILLTLNRSVGTASNILQNGQIVLQPGVYTVSYSVNGSGAAGESIAVTLNGQVLPDLSQQSAATTNSSVSNSGIVSVTQPNSTLGLINNSTDALTLLNANMMITKLS